YYYFLDSSYVPKVFGTSDYRKTFLASVSESQMDLRCLRPGESGFFDIDDNTDNPTTSTTGLSTANEDSEAMEDVILSRATTSAVDDVVDNMKHPSVNRATEAEVAANVEAMEKMGFGTYAGIKLNFTK
ncbi:MAG: hypothetical protein LQ337_008996, partial [Flavoplaca oasis]